jgi:hypothetical protein
MLSSLHCLLSSPPSFLSEIPRGLQKNKNLVVSADLSSWPPSLSSKLHFWRYGATGLILMATTYVSRHLAHQAGRNTGLSHCKSLPYLLFLLNCGNGLLSNHGKTDAASYFITSVVGTGICTRENEETNVPIRQQGMKVQDCFTKCSIYWNLPWPIPLLLPTTTPSNTTTVHHITTTTSVRRSNR